MKRYRILVLVSSAVCYLNSCWGDFVFDDNSAIVSNLDVVSNSSLVDVFTHDFWGTEISHKNSHKSYRPFTILTYRWNYWLAGELNAFLFHLTNIIIHPLVCILYYELCQYLCQKSNSPKGNDWSVCPLIASLMFAVHPIHTESIAGVVGRAELMSAVCYFSALLCYIKSTSLDSSLWSLGGILTTLILAVSAMLFKEQGVTVLGLCVVYDVLFNLKPGIRVKRFAIRVGLVLLFTAAIIVARMASGTPTFKPVDNPASFSNSSMTRVLSYSYIYFLNCWLVLNPSWLCFDWSMGCIPLLHSIFDYRFITIIAFWLAFATLLIFCFLGRKTHFKRLIKMSLAMLVIPYLPACNVVIRVGFVIAERVLYLPSSGWCLLFAIGLSIIKKHHKIHSFLFIMLIVVFISKSLKRSQQWLSEESLFVSGLSVCPTNAKIFYNVGKVKCDKGQKVIAEAAYRRAIALYPEYDQALNNLGNLLKEANEIREAEVMLQRAVSANDEFAVAWMNLGIVKATLNKTEEAELCYKSAIKFRRKYPDAYYNLGNLYIDCGQPADAAEAFKHAIELQKSHVKAWNNLGLLYENQGMYKEAERVLREATKHVPNDPLLYYTLGVLLGRINRLQEAQELLSTAVSLNPTSAEYHANLGVVCHLMKQYKRAEQLYSHALQINPDLVVAKENLIKLQKSQKKQ